MEKARRTWPLLLVLLLAVVVRSQGLKWDGGIGAHPDERYIIGAAEQLSFAGTLNPFQAAPDFAYGHLPLYLVGLAGAVVPGRDPLLVGRALSVLFDVGTVALTFALGKEAADHRVGLLAAALVGLSVAHIQQAHFYTADVLLVYFALASLLFAARFAEEGRERDLYLAGGLAGLAAGTKAVGVFLFIPLAVASCWRERGPGNLGRMSVAAAAAFAAVNPFAVIHWGTFLGNLARQGAILRGAVVVPYTLQYEGTLPLIYSWVQQFRWGTGWLVGSCAAVGMVYEGVRAVRTPAPRAGRWVLLAWVVPMFAFVGGLHAKFPRYVLPILPVLLIYAAQAVMAATEIRPAVFTTVSVLLVGASLARAAALAGMYGVPHPWVAASEWLSARAVPGARIAVEAWDHPLPVDGAGFELLELPVFEEESEEKWRAMERVLDEADYLVVASRRGYATLARERSRYLRTARYYEDLFRGELGFAPAACFGRYPRLGPLGFGDDPTAGLGFSLPEGCGVEAGAVVRLGRLDESFVVYDHPQVVVFVNER